MTNRQRLLRIELPLAAPVLMAGVRTAAVWVIGGATLSTPVGQTSLGNYIFSGLQVEDWVSVLLGCIAAVALALIADQLLGLIEVGVATRRRGWRGSAWECWSPEWARRWPADWLRRASRLMWWAPRTLPSNTFSRRS